MNYEAHTLLIREAVLGFVMPVITPAITGWGVIPISFKECENEDGVQGRMGVRNKDWKYSGVRTRAFR